MVHNLFLGCVASVGFLGAVVFDEHALIPVGSAMAVLGGVWWLGRKLQWQDDERAALRRDVAEIKDWLRALPCQEVCNLIKKEKGRRE